MAKAQKKSKPPVKSKRTAAVAGRIRSAKAGPTVQVARGKLERVKMPPPLAQKRHAPGHVGIRGCERGEVRLLHHQVANGRSASARSASAPIPPTCTRSHYRDIAAVVSNTPMVVQDPTRENVLAHQRVNETVMQQHTVIPMSFGTVFKTDDDIMELLRSAYDAFTDVLNKMQDKFEFGLKVLWDRDQIIREIEEEDEDIRRLKGEISSQKGSTYFARMQYGRLIDAALQARSERYVAEIFRGAARRLGRLAVEQADRRPDDHERRVPGRAATRSRPSTPG